MAILTPSQLISASNATYFDNVSGSITPTSVRSLNDSWVSSSILVSQTSSLSVLSSSYAGTASVLLGSVVSASYALSSSFALTASYALNAGTSIDTGSFVNTSSFNTYTASINSFTSSIQTQVNNLQAATASYITSAQTSSMTVLSASYAISSSQAANAALLNSLSSSQFAQLVANNTFTGNNVFGNITASNAQFNSASIQYLTTVYETASIIYSSGSNQFGDAANDVQTLYGTVDVKTGPLKVTGSLNVTGSLTTTQDINVNGITVGRGAGNQAFNVAVGNQALENNILGEDNLAFGRLAVFANTYGGRNVGIGSAALSATTTGNENTALGAQSFASLTTGNNNTAIGFDAGCDLVNGSNNVFIGCATGSSTLNNNIIFADGAGNVRARYSGSWTMSGIVATTASVAISSSFALTASFYGGSVVSASYAATASSVNTLNQNVVITGSLSLTGSGITINGNINSTNIVNTIVGRTMIYGGVGGGSGATPRLIVSGSDGGFSAFGRGFNEMNTTVVPNLESYGSIFASPTAKASQYLGVYTPVTFTEDVEHAIIVSGSGITFNDFDNGSAFDYVPYMTIAPNVGDNPTPQMKRGLGVTGSLNVSGGITGSLLGTASIAISSSYAVTSSLALTNLYTASVSNNVITFTEGDGTTFSLTVATGSGTSIDTGSFATTGSNVFNGNQTITGSLNVSGGITGSLLGTASYASQALSSSYAVTASYALNGGGGSSFPYTGSAIISGSLTVTGSLNVTGSSDIAGDGLFVSKSIRLYGDGSSPTIEAGNADGSSPYPGMRFLIDDTINPGNIYSFFSIDNLAEPSGTLNFGFTSNTFTSEAPNLASAIFGPGVNNTDDQNTNVFEMYYFATASGDSTQRGSGKLDIRKDTTLWGSMSIKQGLLVTGSFCKFISPTEITGSLNVTGSLTVKGNLLLASGSNKTTGIVTLDGGNPGTVTVSNSLVTGSSMIFLTKQTLAHPNGYVAVSSKGSGTFTITSNHNGDADQVAYMIVNPG